MAGTAFAVDPAPPELKAGISAPAVVTAPVPDGCRIDKGCSGDCFSSGLVRYHLAGGNWYVCPQPSRQWVLPHRRCLGVLLVHIHDGCCAAGG